MQRQNLAIASLLLSASLVAHANEAAPIGNKTLPDEPARNSQTVTRAGTHPSIPGSAQYFTGNVRVAPLFPENDSTPVSAAYVTFEPGARSAWHTHPTGQHLIVTAGTGWTQE